MINYLTIMIICFTGEDSMKYHHEYHNITSSLLIGAVVAALLVILIIIDVSCFVVNDTGLSITF